MRREVVRTHLSGQLILAVKDRLRDVRYQIRSRARSGAPMAVDRLDLKVFRPVLLAADRAFSEVEAVASSLRTDEESDAPAFEFPKPIRKYFAKSAADQFTYEIYESFKRLLRRLGYNTFLVSEGAIDEGLSRLKLRHSDVIAIVLDDSRSAEDRAEATIQLSAALAIELAAAQPIRKIATDDAHPASANQSRAPNEYCALTIALALVLASKRERTADRPEALFEAADLAVNARFAKLSAALREPGALRALAGELAAMLPFLP